MLSRKQANKLPRYTPNPLFASLSDYVKNPANFNKIQSLLLDELASRHTHSEMTNWATCKTCQDKAQERVMLMKKFGFTSAAIYLGWRKTQELLITKKRTILK